MKLRKSDTLPIKSGVSQYSLIYPLLLLIFITDIKMAHRYCVSDDTSESGSTDDIDELSLFSSTTVI